MSEEEERRILPPAAVSPVVALASRWRPLCAAIAGVLAPWEVLDPKPAAAPSPATSLKSGRLFGLSAYHQLHSQMPSFERPRVASVFQTDTCEIQLVWLFPGDHVLKAACPFL